MRFILGVIVAFIILSFAPDVQALGNVRTQIMGMFSGNRAMEVMIAREQQRLTKIRRDFTGWKAEEMCRQEIAEFEHFARDHGLTSSGLSCS